ncbi:phage terminase small subunit [Sphingomonas oryzagri]|uniref:Phage terminase small subunit n=1 Tax=Sphingomonas oryzagri TaxID=3042314 RepID=A0ABT6N7V8_9SPHN|nr:phage terminase small subunit [Sphingomonas oryzagri]MDH7641185.1 phage terminase small subunit [Sphingomonas oryzagri]
MKLRLTHDLRRLKEIQSIERKIATKREMLPEYEAWVAGLLVAGQPSAGDEVLPTIMVWKIDVGDYAGAMPLIEHVFRHRLDLPARYERTASALVVEEIAIGAMKLQLAGEAAPLGILQEIEALTASDDIHDQIRAKIHKAIGVELVRAAEAISPTDPAAMPAIERARAELVRAQALNDRVGVKDKLQRLDRLKKAVEESAAPPRKPAVAKKPAPAKAPARKSPLKKEASA